MLTSFLIFVEEDQRNSLSIYLILWIFVAEHGEPWSAHERQIPTLPSWDGALPLPMIGMEHYPCQWAIWIHFSDPSAESIWTQKSPPVVHFPCQRSMKIIFDPIKNPPEFLRISLVPLDHPRHFQTPYQWSPLVIILAKDFIPWQWANFRGDDSTVIEFKGEIRSKSVKPCLWLCEQ